MNFATYEINVQKTASADLAQKDCLGMGGMGIAEEAGEVAGLIKKHLWHGHELDRTKVIKELGDVLWYLAYLANKIGSSLDEVAEANLNKLALRYPNGFSKEASINRKPGDL